MTFQKIMIDGSVKTQQINTTSLTKGEVAAIYNNISSIMWTRYCSKAHGYPFKPYKLHQDNNIAKLLEMNGRVSSSKRTRHMNTRYFFVADVVKLQHVTIEYYPTDNMIGDFFTKPVRGEKF